MPGSVDSGRCSPAKAGMKQVTDCREDALFAYSQKGSLVSLVQSRLIWSGHS